jgi:hypothetical protein
MFIVAMTLAVIAAMGVYALQISSTEVKTAGFIRQQVQTQYLSQYGVQSIAQALANNAQTYATVMSNQPDTGCFSLFQIWNQPGVTAQAAACHQAGSLELGTEVVPSGSPAATLLSAYTAPGTSDLERGSLGLATFPDFYVEVTDPTQKQPPAGYSTNATSTVCFLEITASSLGMTPTTKVFSATDQTLGNTAGYQSEGLEMARARIIFGPVNCTGTN